ELSGLEAETDIAIEVVGRRPGEKLDEALFNPYERVQPTPAEKISRAERERLDPGVVAEMFDQIALLVLESCQEALTNVAKHADAGRVAVDVVVHDGQVELTVEDEADPSSGDAEYAAPENAENG
ncbi:MAG: polysaccharide biosynthesis protein, partial [Gemmatimonadetes bacterium]|nr:polysaccharide biosynthesis protein [Gemmatimonadota bacterium]